MSAKSQHTNILLAVLGFATVVLIVALIGHLALQRDPEEIQGEMEVEEYRVSGTGFPFLSTKWIGSSSISK